MRAVLGTPSDVQIKRLSLRHVRSSWVISQRVSEYLQPRTEDVLCAFTEEHPENVLIAVFLIPSVILVKSQKQNTSPYGHSPARKAKR